MFRQLSKFDLLTNKKKTIWAKVLLFVKKILQEKNVSKTEILENFEKKIWQYSK